MDKVFNNFNINYAIVNTSDLDEIKEAIDDSVKAIYIETNPLLDITDIESAAELAKEHNLLTMNNTL